MLNSHFAMFLACCCNLLNVIYCISSNKKSKMNFKYSSPRTEQNNKRDRRIKGCESLDQNGTFIEHKSTELKSFWPWNTELHTSHEGHCIEKTLLYFTQLTRVSFCKNIFLYHKSHQGSLLRFLSEICLCNSLCLLRLRFNLTQLIGKGITTWSKLRLMDF